VSLTLADPPLQACADPSPGTQRNRWAFWRSPPGQPWWARPVLLGIAAVAAVLYTWNLSNAGLAPLYSVAVKSMSESWKAFFYGAFDPRSTITTDKLAGSFLPQALSARIFGFHPWSLALPQVIEGVVCILVMYRVVRRWAGVVPGLLAAAVFALTPIATSMFGHSMEDGALTMCLVLAADSYQRAVMQARLRSLIWAGVWVGLGFQAKMLEAWVILPALAIGYLLAAPAPSRRRLAHLAAAGGVTLLVSLSWIILYLVTPAAGRPYVDGSTSNNAAAMVFGYNGLARFGVTLPGAAAPANSVLGGVSSGWGKLFGSRLGPEIAWLVPLALLTLACGLLLRRRAERTDQIRAGLVMWGIWLLTFGVMYSAMSVIPHTAYVASLAPPIAALSGAGIVMLWRWYHTDGLVSWVFPGAIAAQLAWAGYLWSAHSTFLPWLLPTGIAAGVIAIGWLMIARLPRRDWTALAAAGAAAGIVAMLAAPAAWAVSVLDTKYAGSPFDAGAGPPATSARSNSQSPGGPAKPAHGQPGSAGAVTGQAGAATGARPAGPTSAGPSSGGPAMLGSAGATATLDPAQEKVFRYVTAHRAGASYVMAVQSETAASPYILATGQEVMPMGGVNGFTPEPTLAQAQQLVRSGQLRFFLLGTHNAPIRPGTQIQRITSWVEQSCSRVPAQDYGGTPGHPGRPSHGGPVPPGGSRSPGAAHNSSSSPTLYRCPRTA
jgi:4-amino-4-deoxy-L-arabinose transferase-like glycosyltransferase